MDLSNLSLSEPQHLPLLLACGAIVAGCAFVLGRRHSRTVRATAAGLRLAALAALGVVLMAPVVTVQSETRFEPGGVWRAVLPGAEPEPAADVIEFREPGDVFVNRVRDALAGESPPQLAEVHAPEREQAVRVRDRVQALGVPCEAFYPNRETERPEPVLTGIDAPLAVRPGEPFRVEPGVAGPAKEVRMFLNGEALEIADGRATVRTDRPGRHILESVLLDGNGVELQRTGRVFRVGDKPNVLALGLSGEQLGRAAALAPDFAFTQRGAGDFTAGDLEDVAVVMASVDAVNQLNAGQVHGLATFVGRGGGLYVTGDGAKYVAPEYLNDDVRRLLPVILRKEGKKPPEEDPPVKEEKERVEIAKVSMLFLLDRSTSMDAAIGNSNVTRWSVARRGVVESIKLVERGGKQGEESMSESIATRIGVMTFTLSQHWVYKPYVVLPHDRNEIDLSLSRLRGDNEYDEQGYNTDIYAAMEKAIDAMKDEPSAVRVIVMMTDGGDRPANTLADKRHGDLRDRALKHDINVISVGIGEAFAGHSADSAAAQKVIRSLATKPGFAYFPSDEASAKEAHVIFLDAVETAFEAYDDKKDREEEERRKRIEEQKQKEEEPEKVDVMPGTFPLRLMPAGRQLYGPDALPDPAPKAAWLARNFARDDAAVALAADTEDDGSTPVLAFRAYGLGRVAFWGAGTSPEDLGELTGWGDFPAIFAASLRWLTPREQPDVRLVGEAHPDGIRILDPIEGATYRLRTDDGEYELVHEEGMLRPAEGTLPPGPGEVIERIQGEETTEVRIGDVYVSEPPPVESRPFAVDHAREIDLPRAREPEMIEHTRKAVLPVLYLLTMLLMLMPVERFIRRRT